jgi:hypothetical protein
MARLSAHGTEVVRLRKGAEQSSMTLSFRSDGAVLKKSKHGSWDSGWKLHLRRTTTPFPDLIADLKTKDWKEVRGHG